MAIYSFNARIIGRSHEGAATASAAYQSAKPVKEKWGRHQNPSLHHGSAMAAAAYQSAERLRDGSDGRIFEYGRAERVKECGIELPENITGKMREYLLSRENLWNAVEAAERQPNAQLARRLIMAIPRELSEAQQKELVLRQARDYAQAGMAVDWAIHNDPDNHNPHVHMLLTMRPFAEPGKWNPEHPETAFVADKTGKEYEVRRGGEARWISAKEWQAAKEDGWEKVFNFYDPEKVVRNGQGAINWRKTPCEHMTPSEAAERGYERRSKHPIARKSAEQPWEKNEENRAQALVVWREQWARRCNEALKAAGRAERVDHRSYKAQGIDKVPQQHLGPRVAGIERKARMQAKAQGREYEPVTRQGRHNALALAINRARVAMAKQAMAMRRFIVRYGHALEAQARRLEEAMEKLRARAARVKVQSHKRRRTVTRDARQERAQKAIERRASKGIAPTSRETRMLTPAQRKRIQERENGR